VVVVSVLNRREGTMVPDEREHLAVILAGRSAPAAIEILAELEHTLGLPGIVIDQQTVPAGLHPARSAQLLIDGVTVGEVGEIDPFVLEAFAVRERVAWLQLDVAALLSFPHGEHRYHSISRYPSSDLDLAFETPDSVSAASLTGALRSSAGSLLVAIDLFDVFRGGTVPDGSRSLAYRLRLQSAERTLTDEDVAGVLEAAVAAASALGATLRG
jgi:phenylalanyl-tRNA synthetase beta chain